MAVTNNLPKYVYNGLMPTHTGPRAQQSSNTFQPIFHYGCGVAHDVFRVFILKVSGFGILRLILVTFCLTRGRSDGVHKRCNHTSIEMERFNSTVTRGIYILLYWSTTRIHQSGSIVSHGYYRSLK